MKWKLICALGFAFLSLSLPRYALSAHQHTCSITATYKINSSVPELPESAMLLARLGIGFL